MKKVCYLLFISAILACNTKNETTTKPTEANNIAPASNVNLADYELETVPGSTWQKAIKRDAAGKVIESGFFENGQKVGSWLLYEDDLKRFPSKLFTYEAGKLNGVYMEYNEGGQIVMLANYYNNVLHGYWGKYRFARVLEEANYKNGQLDGIYNVYSLKDGVLQTSAEYKNGVQDGFYRTYNPEGQITTEYIYKNGEKVRGGAVK
ncbi:MAG: toxin-antitoxin system YwqK family antitoxin [Saprospiraceae bacterium]